MNKTTLSLLLMTLAMVCYGATNAFIKKAGLSAFQTMFVQIGILWLCILPFFIVSRPQLLMTADRTGIMFVVLAGIINFIGYFLLVKAINYLLVWQVNMFFVLIPLFGGIAGFLLLKETLTLKFFLGLVITFAGLLVALR